MTTHTLQVKGMHCASCASIITKKISALDGVENVDVNYATEQAHVNFDTKKVSVSHMNHEIEKLGYSLVDHSHVSSEDHQAHLGLSQSKDEKMRELLSMKGKAEFVLPISLLVFLLMMWDIGAQTVVSIPRLPIPMDMFNLIGLVLSTVVLFWIGQPFLQGVVRFARYRVANMDTLIGIGTLTAYIYSAVITLMPQVRDALSLPEFTYFDVTIVVIGFVVFGKYLEARSRMRTGEAVEKLLGLQAKTALVFRDGAEMEISIADVVVGDVVVVKPGSKIPVDGIIIEGKSSIDESMVSGEAIPVDKVPGDVVIGATLNKQGSFRFTATKIGSDTVLSQIIKMVERAQGSKAPIQALADRISSIFVPTVLVIALVTLALWLTWGASVLGFSTALAYGLSSFVGILVIACPCALGLATPTAIIVGVGKGAEFGILIKDAEGLEKLSKIDVVVFDKTGTLTKGKPEVTDIVVLEDGWTEMSLIAYAAGVEILSEHPLAQAIVDKAEDMQVAFEHVENFLGLEGVGVSGDIHNKKIYIHKPDDHDKKDGRIKDMQNQGKTVVVVEVENRKIGLIALSDVLKQEVGLSIRTLHSLGIKTVLLTGDNHLTAGYIAKLAGIDTVIAEVLPQEKADKVKELQQKGLKVAMVGDGINDAPALVSADVGVAMATGTDIAIESASITLLGGDMSKLVQAINLSKATMKTVKQNLFWAFIYNVIGIPVAAGLLYPLWGITLNPVFAGAAMAFSSVSVVGNSLRLKTKKLK